MQHASTEGSSNDYHEVPEPLPVEAAPYTGIPGQLPQSKRAVRRSVVLFGAAGLVVVVAAVVAFISVGQGSASATKSGGVGDILNFANSNGDKVSATFDKVVDPADPSTSPPPAGYRYVAAELQVYNRGNNSYTDDPSKATLTDADGHTYLPIQVLPEVISNVGSGATDTGNTIPAGDSAIDVIVFEVPVNIEITAIHYMAAGQTGLWKIG